MSFDRPDFSLGTRDFSAGFLDTPESDTLPDGAVVAGRNGWFHAVDLDGSRRRATGGKRPGDRLLTPSAVVAGTKCDGLVDFRQEANPSQLLGAWAGGWYRWNEFDAFTAIATAIGYVAGNPARAALFKGQAFLHDGSKQQLYDGLTARPVGFVKPTGVTAMTAGAGPGVTGTYTAKYLWFDQLHNHESSISDDATAALVLVNQSRVHTKPAGAPPAHVTHWRAYVRREDTSEALWMRVATVAIGTATFTEAIVDGARKDPAPLIGANDPPTLTFKVAVEYLGFLLGFPDGSSDMHVSKQGDCESYHPSDILKIGAGAGKANRSAHRVGTSEVVIQKPTASYHLVGSRMPFKIDELVPDWGNVGQDAAVSIGGRLYAWDETKGPYWTDLTNWITITDGRVENVVKTVSKLDAADIRCAHAEDLQLVVWAVPTTGSPRKRTLLAYHYGFDSWLPPITGLEYGALASYLANDGTLRLLMGDHWGRLWSLFEGGRDAPNGGTVSGTVTSATSGTLVDTTAAFVTAGSGLAGVPVAVQHPTTGVWQWRRILSNSATTLLLDTTNGAPWSASPAAGWHYLVGGIEWWQAHPWLDGGAPLIKKKGGFLQVQFKPSADDHSLNVAMRFNDDDGTTDGVARTFAALTGAALWGVALWGSGIWSSVLRRGRKARVGRSFYSVQIAFSNYEPDQPMIVTGFSLGADALSRRGVRSAP